MEQGIIRSDLKDQEIKPKALLRKYCEWVVKEKSQFFKELPLRAPECPACGSAQVRSEFSKMDFLYRECGACLTFYTASLPTQEQLYSFFRTSESRKYWAEQIWKVTANSRRAKIIEPMTQWIELFLDQYVTQYAGHTPSQRVLGEMMPVQWGLWESFTQRFGLNTYHLINPCFDLGLSPVDDQQSGPSSAQKMYDALILNHTLSRVENPRATLSWAAEHLIPGGLCFLTTTLASGFDLIELRERADFLIPPDHLTAPSWEGLQNLIASLPFEILEMSTPGVLDLQHLEEYSDDHPEKPLSPFLNYLLRVRHNPELNKSLQEFLQEHRLSSQARVVLRKIQ